MPLLSILANLFPFWILLGGLLALLHPPLFTWFRGSAILWALSVIMLGMGLTLQVSDFRNVAKMPRPTLVGLIGHYLIMPFSGWAIALLFDLPTPFAVGLILVACCPSGTASNVVNYLAQSNVALSVVMTTLSTFAGIVMTPLLTSWLVGTRVHVDALGLFVTTLQVILVPVLAGVTLHHTAPRLTGRIVPAMPLLSVAAIVLIVGSIIGQNAGAVKECGIRLLLAVALLHGAGFAFGYLFARVLRCDIVSSRTISIEVGMQNSGLGIVLAQKHFADPLTAIPCAISSVFHSLLGSLLAGWWRWQSRHKLSKTTFNPLKHARY
jgi:BASS family bile acid:Na+ symporter